MPSFIPRCCSSGKEAMTPVFPKFISVGGADNSQMSQSNSRFRLISYNILAQAYVKSTVFPHSPRLCLKWKARSQAVLSILKSFDSDFLCLQELDELESFYKSYMETYGYLCIYVKRPGQKRDGCGIFYKCASVELLLMEEIEYNDLVDNIDSKFSTDGESMKKFETDCMKKNLKRDCVGILAAFRLKNQHLVILANTHIFWDPEWIDVKLAQVEYMLFRLSRFKEVVSEKFKCSPSVIVAGDFNSTPMDEVYQRLVSGGNLSEKSINVWPNIPLTSLYASVGGEPPFTNCTPNFTGTLDYIFFSNTGCLKPTSYLQVSGPDSPDVAGGLPNFYHPSDHLPIGADFEVIPHEEKTGSH